MTGRRSATYDAILVGTGFASTFFLHRYLQRQGPGARVLVLERGQMRTHRWQLDGGRTQLEREARASFVNRTPSKPWVFTNAFGGGSNCWNACVPRMMPDDFRLRSLCGVGEDWPLTYNELESYYCDAEELMQVAGDSDDPPSPRSRPYPQPPHAYSTVDKLLKRHYPEHVFVQPAARPTRPTANRPRCCANSVCWLCPIDSKFTVLNEMSGPYRDPRVTLALGAAVQGVELSGGRVATAVVYLKDGASHGAAGDLVVLGANALFNPHILLRSGLSHPQLGRGLVEQLSRSAVAYLDGVNSFDGSTLQTGYGYMLHGRERRARQPAAILEFLNAPRLRPERGKWRQVLAMNVNYEELRLPDNRVTVSAEDPTKPEVTYAVGFSDYLLRGWETVERDLERLLAPLPVEYLDVSPEPYGTAAHIIGTTVMGNDPNRSVVDRNSVYHGVHNLLVLGSGTFPTASPANPSLTISALALRAADFVSGRAREGA